LQIIENLVELVGIELFIPVDKA